MSGVREYEISQMLRGQAGTTAMIEDVWPAGSFVVVLDGRPKQITIPSASRGLDRHYRYGPAKSVVGSASFKHVVYAFKGNGYRPYPVTHLRAIEVANGLTFTWIRATRIDGDFWSTGDVPLGEHSELYQVTVYQSRLVKRQTVSSTASWTYPASQQASDLVFGGFEVAVAQVSGRYGAGLAMSIDIASQA